MKLDVINLEGEKTEKIDLPEQFNESVRPDLIKRAFLVIQANKRQEYGASPQAGKRASAKLSRRRRDYKRSYGLGISRVPRKTLWRRGTQFGWVGAFAPGMVGGRKVHTPKASKDWGLKINKKERKKAIRSAIAATASKEHVGRGIEKQLPLVIESKLEYLSKTKEVREFIKKIGLGDELKRTAKRKVRAGRGKSRGRKYQTKKGPLIVVSKDCPLIKAARNIQGLDIEQVKLLNVELLAPGANPGRLTIYTKDSIEKMSKENLFI